MKNTEAIQIIKNPAHVKASDLSKALDMAVEALEKQSHTCKNCGERDSDGWCKVVNVSCDVLEYCGCWSEVEQVALYKVWVRLEEEYDDIEAETEEEAFIIASDLAMEGGTWQKAVDEVK